MEAAGGVNIKDLPPSAQEEVMKEHPELAMKAGLIEQTKENKQNKRRKQYFHKGPQQFPPCQLNSSLAGDLPARSSTGGVQTGQLIYEWDQGLDEVNIYINPPPGIKASLLDISITSTHLSIGIKGNLERFLNHNLGGKCKHSESFWTLEDAELHITLTKLAKGVPWDSALEGHQPLDPVTATEVRKDIMRERFAEEHPGFYFSGAEINGNVPDPSKFMGGVSYR